MARYCRRTDQSNRFRPKIHRSASRDLLMELICYLISLETLSPSLSHQQSWDSTIPEGEPGFTKPGSCASGGSVTTRQVEPDRSQRGSKSFNLSVSTAKDGGIKCVCVCVCMRHSTQTVLKIIKAQRLISNKNNLGSSTTGSSTNKKPFQNKSPRNSFCVCVKLSLEPLWVSQLINQV